MSRYHETEHEDFGGLHRDLAATAKVMSRRRVVQALGAIGSATLAASCGDKTSPTSPTSSSSGTTDATLSGLTLSSGSVSPAFSASAMAYTVSVDNAVASTTVTAIATSSTATIKVNGATVASGVASGAVALALGTTVITIGVTAADNSTTRTYTITVTRSTTVASSCTTTPNETAGPYPGDGSNGPNVLLMSGIVRSDIRSSFGGMTGTADGVPLTIVLTLVSASTCAPLVGRAVYLWHCTRTGQYSLYSSGITNQNYLRGIQETDGNGQVTFMSIYPACYSGRWPHIHFEVYPSLASATNAGNKVATSQIAMPRATNDVVYGTSGYEQSVANQASVSLATDNVFSDGYLLELATVTGSVAGGFIAMLTVAV